MVLWNEQPVFLSTSEIYDKSFFVESIKNERLELLITNYV